MAKVTKAIIEELAKERLVDIRQCSVVRTEEYTIPCYGKPGTLLTNSRRWIYEQEKRNGLSDEEATNYAQNLSLYVNRKEFKAMCIIVRALMSTTIQ